ncbi:STAS domain-containing protein [Nonomuraea sp. NN258]|uniref:STAS domain-containing protein n=1 Tax=Nonomuraea antri TaxID=2730852 RepID=UPI00156A2FB0|nr:STAS domain-containing protein [Nonomuraea antri]NRQ34524.1 STAS domain-containing protein [Nonomuraea antri]
MRTKVTHPGDDMPHQGRAGPPPGDHSSRASRVEVRHLVTKGGPALIVTLMGCLDAEAIADLRRLLTARLADPEPSTQPTHLIVDATRLTFCDEAVLRALLDVHQAIRREGGRVVVADAGGMLAQRLRRTRLDSILELYPSLSAAEAAVAGLGPVDDGGYKPAGDGEAAGQG